MQLFMPELGVNEEKEKGEKLLQQKDSEIQSLQNKSKETQDKYEAQVKGLEQQSVEMAKKAETYKDWLFKYEPQESKN